MAQPIYKHIEFCRSPKTLWGKLDSGLWEWLGVAPDRRFVLGSPRRSGVLRLSGDAEVGPSGAEALGHRVRVRSPAGGSTTRWFRTAEEARSSFEQKITGEADGAPRVLLVELFEGGQLRDEEYVVSRGSTYR